MLRDVRQDSLASLVEKGTGTGRGTGMGMGTATGMGMALSIIGTSSTGEWAGAGTGAEDGEGEGEREDTNHLSQESGVPVLDPLTTRGFINIRMKPPSHSRGLSRMTFPMDTTVTICGSLLMKDHETLITEMKHKFDSIRGEYQSSTIFVQSANPFSKQLTSKVSVV